MTDRLAPTDAPAHQVADLLLTGDLLTAVSHELRTPLASILGYAEILAEDSDHPPAVARMLDAIRRNAARQARVLDNLTLLADLDRGDIPRCQEPVDLAELLADLPAAVAEGGAELGQRLRVTVAPGLPAVPGHAGCLRRALAELALHAIETAPAGDPLQVTAGTEAGGDLVVTIAPATPADTASDPADDPAPAVRLGLALADRIITQHGGRVRHPAGAATTVRLPTTGPHRPTGAQPARSDPSDSQ
jgi:signal transduction histidine kinase